MLRRLLITCALFQIFNLACSSNSKPDDPRMPREEVRRAIRTILPEIKKCYEDVLITDITAKGKLVIKFEIQDDGKIRSSTTMIEKTKWQSADGKGTESTSLKTVGDCVNQTVAVTTFPAAPSGTVAVVEYPFVFDKR